MVSKRLKIVWDDPAKEYLKKSIQHIKMDSPQNAAKVKGNKNGTKANTGTAVSLPA